MYILNSFSLNMLASLNARVEVKEISLNDAKKIAENAGIVSAIGHVDTACVLSNVLDCDIEFNRISVTLSAGDSALVCQLSGQRLPEGCTKLPENSNIKFAVVKVLT